MHVWVLQVGESIAGIDANARDWRCGMLSRALLKNGHTVLWWTSNFDHLTKRYRYASPRTIENIPGLKIRFLQSVGYSSNISIRRLLFHVEIAKAFRKESAHFNKPDAILCALPIIELAESAIGYSQQNRVPIVIDIQDLWPDHYLTLVAKPLRQLARWALFHEFRRVRNILGKATGISAISETFLKWGLDFVGRDQCSSDYICPMGYPEFTESLLSRAAIQKQKLIDLYKLSPDDFVVVFVGTFVSSFDFFTVIDAARMLNQAGNQQIKFFLVGEGDHGKRLREYAEGLPNVIFPGWCDHVSVLAMLSLGAVGLAPYRRDASMSLPNKPFEYMAAGLPVISSLHGELEDLIRDERIGIQYSSENKTMLAEKVLWLADNPLERLEMGRRSKNLFEKKYKADVVYPQFVKHLEQIVGQGWESER